MDRLYLIWNVDTRIALNLDLFFVFGFQTICTSIYPFIRPSIHPSIYIYLPMELSWEWDPSPKSKFIYVSYITYIVSLKVISYNIFSVYVLTATHHEVRYGIFHSWPDIGAWKVLDFLIFWISYFRLEMLNLYLYPLPLLSQ